MEWGISLKCKKRLKNSLWFNIFLRVAAIFLFFVIVITVSNSAFLERFFISRQKKMLKTQMSAVEKLDISDSDAVSRTLSDISDSYFIDAEIYDSSGKILYTTHGSQMMDFIIDGHGKFEMQHEELSPKKKPESKADGSVFEADRPFGSQEYLVCVKELKDGNYAELRLQKSLVTDSAKTAGEFISLIAGICFLVSLIWIVLFARKFSKPLSVMNDITSDMAQLKFDRKIETARKDEIGQLALSINKMSDSLSATLGDLKRSNSKLKDEIELERSLDVMRRAFVANVSHELKTPISIISGYAEGLKLNINSQSREAYCDTIIDESKRMNKLVLSILELSRYESGQVPLNNENFRILPLAEKTAERIFKGKNINVSVEIGSDTVINADPLQTEQILKAYLENAASHTNDGGSVTVTASNRDEKTVRISVFNTGSHINEEDMPQIWQSFYRGDTSHKRDESRFGLGLSIVNAICRRQGCDCGVFNTDDGVCFWFDAKREIRE